jgi:hypothetical protein
MHCAGMFEGVRMVTARDYAFFEAKSDITCKT